MSACGTVTATDPNGGGGNGGCSSDGDCPSGQICDNGTCVDDGSGGNGGDDFSPSNISIDSCATSGQAQVGTDAEINVTVSNGNSQAADVDFSILASPGDAVIAQGTVTVPANSTESATVHGGSSLDPGDYSLEAWPGNVSPTSSHFRRRISTRPSRLRERARRELF